MSWTVPQKAIAAVGTSISGSIFSPDFAVELAGRGIAATNTTTGEIFSTFTLNDGSFVLGRLTAGTHEFTVPDAEITQVTPSVVELLEGEALTGVLIDIDAGTGLTGSITNESGETVPGAAVYLFDGNTVVDFDSADEDGAYAFEGLGPGTFTMAVDTPGLARTWVTDVDTTSGNVNVDVQAAPESQLTGTVTVGGVPSADATVFATLETGLPFALFPTGSDDAGVFSLAGLPAGTYDLSISTNAGEAIVIENVVLFEGQSLDLKEIDVLGGGSGGGSKPLSGGPEITPLGLRSGSPTERTTARTSAPAAPDDIVVEATFGPPAGLEVGAFDVQRGMTQRSFVRYLDVTFNQTGFQELIDTIDDADANNDRIVLQRFELDGGGSGGNVELAGKVAAVDQVMTCTASAAIATPT